MASAFSHAIVALAMGRAVRSPVLSRGALAMGVACSILPDVDVLGFYVGIDYGALWGHRGLTHSLFFAMMLSAALVGLFYPGRQPRTMATIAGYLFLCTASHGVLDALTDGGLGVAFLAPFDQSRYFFPVRPVAVSPIGITEFFSAHGVQVLLSEAKWIWLPSLVLWAGVRVLIYAAPSRQWFTNYPR